MVLPPQAPPPPLANEARLLCDGLVVRKSVSVDAGDEHRASRLMALIGLGDRGQLRPECSLGIVLRPSGPYARICGDDPR